ncbi:LacI family DNA-binding transcriptional regulator [Bacillus sp. JCM 19034]|uniref:LacI family DNA-binding transcriptional regulator n=1 Tax=Bacillus sp. JCM 19034 TaxID=1481928 RepID=UPI0007820A48|nr:LacI family DNA-binding transcriptional regulator [Bacillus sp. JCM 19034]
MSVTIKDIAKKAGVSYSTVSKALRDSPLVKQPTKVKIKQIAEQLGYQPNVAARSLVQKKSFTVGVIWPTVERLAPALLITKLNELLEEYSYTTLLSINKVDQAIATFNRFQVDAIIVFGEHDNVNELSEKSTVPILHYGVQTKKDAPTIDVNRQYAIKLAVKHLKELGHQNIAFIGTSRREIHYNLPNCGGFLKKRELKTRKRNIISLLLRTD